MTRLSLLIVVISAIVLFGPINSQSNGRRKLVVNKKIRNWKHPIENKHRSRVDILMLEKLNLTRIDLSIYNETKKNQTTYIRLAHNLLTEIRNHTFEGWCKIKQLNVNNNKLKLIENRAFLGTKLRFLYLDGNDLICLPDVSYLTRLDTFAASSNRLTNCASDRKYTNKGHGTLPVLRLVILRFNQFKEFPSRLH